MKYVSRLFMLPMLALFAFTSCDSDDDVPANQVPLSYKTALNALYPDAAKVEWERDGGYYVADFTRIGYDYDVWFGNEAAWAMTSIDYGRSMSELPETVTSAFAASGYVPGVTVDEVKEYQRPAGIFYIIEVESDNDGKETNLFYSPDGTLLRSTTADVDIRPDFSI